MSNAQPTVSSTGNSPFSDLPSIYVKLAEAKARKGLTFEQLANVLGKDEVWVAAAFYGQAKMTPDQIDTLAKALDMDRSDLDHGLGAHWWPNRGLGKFPPTDPLLYRLYEGMLVYGHPIKAIIHEKFNGDGIMSMVDCKVHVEKKPDPMGDRVLLTFDGKFMRYAPW